MDVIAWLLDSDPAVQWQALRDLTDAPAGEVAAARARVATQGWGAQLLAARDRDGQWAGGACFPADFRGDFSAGQPWTSTLPSLALLRDFGVDPTDSQVRDAIEQVRRNCHWEYDDSLAFFDGEVEPCINGRTVAIGAYFGVAVDGIVERLLGEQLADGGWNCEAENGSVRSSFHSTMCVLEGLLEYERAGGRHDVAAARRRGEDYLLERRLMRRLSTGEVADADWLLFSFPPQWHYDVLRGLDHFRAADRFDERLGEALDLVRSKRAADDSWPLENTHRGAVHFALDDGDGAPSRWNTLRALRVLRWADAQA